MFWGAKIGKSKNYVNSLFVNCFSYFSIVIILSVCYNVLEYKYFQRKEVNPMKKRIPTFVTALSTLLMCTVSVFAGYTEGPIGPTAHRSYVSLSYDFSDMSATATNTYNVDATDSYCRAYIHYDNGEYLHAWDTGFTSASATVVHDVFPCGAKEISSFSSEHRVTIASRTYNGYLYS